MSELDYLGGFGWIETPLVKKAHQAELYSWTLYVPMVAAAVEKEVQLDPRFSAWYDQDGKSACTSVAALQIMAAYNTPQNGAMQYDWWTYYCELCKIDRNPQTSCKADIGSYLFAAWDLARSKGPIVKGGAWTVDQGIASYRWITGAGVVDQARTAHGEGLLSNDGVPWFSGWTKSNLVQKSGRYFLPPRSKWGKVVGGHSIGKYGALDSLQAFVWNNTWGSAFPKVCVPYTDWEYLMLQAGGESCVIVDKTYEPPPPPPPPTELDYIDLAGVSVNGKKYSGRITEVK